MILYDSTRFRTSDYEEWSLKAQQMNLQSLDLFLLKKTRKRLNQSNFYSERWFTNLLDTLEVHTGLRVKCCTNYPILNRYFVDFYFKDLRFAVEIDGKSHDGKEAYDNLRDSRISKCGIKIFRIRAMDSGDFGMFKKIFKALLGKEHTNIPVRQNLQIVGLKKKKNRRRKSILEMRTVPRQRIKENPFLVERKKSTSPRFKVRKKAV